MLSFFAGYEGHALLAGIGIALVEVAQGYIRQYLLANKIRARRSLHPAKYRNLFKLMLELVWSLGAPVLALYLGFFSTQDIGIPLPDWRLALPWIAVTLAAALVWIGWLWGRHWVRHPEERPDLHQAEQTLSIAGVLAHVLSQEGYSASTRAALIPLCGTYWGVWAGIAAKIGVSLLVPVIRADFSLPGKRDLVLLDWASDLVCGALFVLTGSIIITGSARLVLRCLVLALARWLPSKVGSVNNQGKDN